MDVITLWTWDSNDLSELKMRYEKAEERFPDKRKLLGIYIYDFKNRIPIPVKLMEHQCTLGLELMKQGRLDGLIFTANSLMGVGLPGEKWLRQWTRDRSSSAWPEA